MGEGVEGGGIKGWDAQKTRGGEKRGAEADTVGWAGTGAEVDVWQGSENEWKELGGMGIERHQWGAGRDRQKGRQEVERQRRYTVGDGKQRRMKDEIS
jgi:hypothetical protein